MSARPEGLEQELRRVGGPWLSRALPRVAADAAAVGSLFPAVGRACGRDPLPGLQGWTVDRAARVRLLLAVPLRGEPLAEVVSDLYRYGDPAERLAVLHGLDLLDEHRDLGPAGLPIVLDALRTNDARLVGAALGPYAGRHLPGRDYRQAVLKCLFVGIPLDRVPDLERRADAELARMLLDYARERRAAGRPVPLAVWPVVRRHSSPQADDDSQE